MKRINIKTFGFFGDILFQSSIAKYLKETDNYIVYTIQFPQLFKLLLNNPYIDEVRVKDGNETYKEFDVIHTMRPFTRHLAPPAECKMWVGIGDYDPSYKVFTDKTFDIIARTQFEQFDAKPTVAVMRNWNEKTFRFTKEQYAAGINVPNLGYGGARRDTQSIIEAIRPYVNLIEVGKPDGYSQHNREDVDGFARDASVLKFCDYFIGSEGGLANLAAGVGCPTILTGDFVHQLYGWNGVIQKLQNPQLGPHLYFPKDKHVMLDPYLSDEEVANQIKEIIL